jgi:hypothetical protein
MDKPKLSKTAADNLLMAQAREGAQTYAKGSPLAELKKAGMVNSRGELTEAGLIERDLISDVRVKAAFGG